MTPVRRLRPSQGQRPPVAEFEIDGRVDFVEGGGRDGRLFVRRGVEGQVRAGEEFREGGFGRVERLGAAFRDLYVAPRVAGVGDLEGPEDGWVVCYCDRHGVCALGGSARSCGGGGGGVRLRVWRGMVPTSLRASSVKAALVSGEKDAMIVGLFGVDKKGDVILRLI